MSQAESVIFGSGVVQLSFRVTSRFINDWNCERRSNLNSSPTEGKFPNFQNLGLEDTSCLTSPNPCCRLFVDFASPKTHNMATTRIEIILFRLSLVRKYLKVVVS